jgi:hypothetical protein
METDEPIRLLAALVGSVRGFRHQALPEDRHTSLFAASGMLKRKQRAIDHF